MWAPDGRELFYWNIDFTKLMKVDISPGQNLSAGTPKLLFEFAATGSIDDTHLRHHAGRPALPHSGEEGL